MRWIFSIIVIFATTSCVSSSKYEELENKHKASVETNAALSKDIEDKKSQVQELETLTSQLERRLGQASDDKESLRASVVQMKQALKEMTERRKETERRMAEFRKLISRLKSFTKAGKLSIKIVDGRMVVALPGDVLFKSGSAKMSKEGQSTVAEVSKILNEVSERSFQVEGHTDNVPIKTANFPSNWELAAQRSANVVKQMIDAGMSQERISVASFADTRPVASNDSPDGRQLNRRIEIVVVPDLAALPGSEELTNMAEKL